MAPTVAVVVAIAIVVLFARGEPVGAAVVAVLALPIVLFAIRRERRGEP